MIRSALQTVVAAFVAVCVTLGTVLCVLLWRDDRRAPAFVLAASPGSRRLRHPIRCAVRRGSSASVSVYRNGLDRGTLLE